MFKMQVIHIGQSLAPTKDNPLAVNWVVVLQQVPGDGAAVKPPRQEVNCGAVPPACKLGDILTVGPAPT